MKMSLDRRGFMKAGVGALGALSLSSAFRSSVRAAESDRLPNIVVIFIDDMGYADIGPFGAKGYATPNLDRMASEGRVFTDFYVPQAVCSASRAGLMTGCYSNRVGILGALGPNAKIGISADEMTMAEVCKQKGYATSRPTTGRGSAMGNTPVRPSRFARARAPCSTAVAAKVASCGVRGGSPPGPSVVSRR